MPKRGLSEVAVEQWCKKDPESLGSTVRESDGGVIGIEEDAAGALVFYGPDARHFWHTLFQGQRLSV
jgi:hypothetical protein